MPVYSKLADWSILNMTATGRLGWQQLLPDASLYHGAGRYPIDAYSEFMPPPRLGWKPYANEPPDPQVFDPIDPWGWYVSEYEEANEIQPGLEQIARQLAGKVRHTLRGNAAHGLAEGTRRSRRQTHARTLRRSPAAGPVAHPGRQRPCALDAFRRL
jgi:hypothetical protein